MRAKLDNARRWAVVRGALGFAQMFAAVVALVLIWETGFSPRALTAVVVACTLTTVSVMLFGAGRRR